LNMILSDRTSPAEAGFAKTRETGISPSDQVPVRAFSRHCSRISGLNPVSLLHQSVGPRI
jgi:hypothetical protein